MVFPLLNNSSSNHSPAFDQFNPPPRSDSPVAAPSTSSSRATSTSISTPLRTSQSIENQFLAKFGRDKAPPAGPISGGGMPAASGASLGLGLQPNGGVQQQQQQQPNTGAGVTKDGQPAPTDSITLGQLKAITAAFPKPKQTLYTFPSPQPDTSDLRTELEEFYSYTEIAQVLDNKASFLASWPYPISFVQSPRDAQLAYIRSLLPALTLPDSEPRFAAARHLLYISQGTFDSSTSPEHHLHLVLSNSALLREAGALPKLWDAVKAANSRWEGASGPFVPAGMQPEDAADRMTQEKQEYLDEANGELGLLLGSLYFLVEVNRGDEEWADELMALEPPMPIHLFNMVAGLREKSAKGYPVKKLLLLLWKSLLATLGGAKDVSRVKCLVREIEGLPQDDPKRKSAHRPETKVSPPDYQSFRNEITSKYPSYVAAPLPPPLPSVDLDRLSAAAAPAPVRLSFSYHINPNHLEAAQPIHALPQSQIPHPQQPPQPATPAPTPPQSPNAQPAPPKPKKQQFQTDQNRPFVLPFAPANAGPKGRPPRAVPKSIEEAADLYSSNMRMSTELWQTWKLREEFVADESGILKAQKEEARGRQQQRNRMEEVGRVGEDEEEEEDEEELQDPLGMLRVREKRLGIEIEKETDEKVKKANTIRRFDIKRLERVEVFYRAVLPQMQSTVIVLLKLLLAAVTATQNATTASNGNNQGGQDSGADEVADHRSDEEIDINRHREITSKAVSAVLVLALKWFKTSHIMKFHYLSQLLVDSNCLLLILKMFGLQEVTTSIKAKNDRPDHNFFKFCNDAVNPPSLSTGPRAEDALLRGSPPGARPTSPKAGEADDEVELVTDFSWRNFFTTVNFVHVLQKLTKRKTHRVLLLVQYKSSAILKRILKVTHPVLQLYVLKVIKSQVPYCGRKWRQSNMKVITAIYLHCRPDLRDEWLTGVDVDADVEESLPHEQALRALVRFFNTKHYGAYAPQLHRRSSSQNPAGGDFGQMPPQSPNGAGGRPPSENDVFPPTRSMATFDADGNVASPRPAGVGGTGDDDLDLGAYDVEELLYPTFDSDGELDFDPMSSRAAWDRLGDFMGHYDDISDGESVGALDFLGLEREDSDGSESSVSDMELDDEVDGEKTRQEWEAISPETITALEEERNANSPRSPRPRGRRSSNGPISPALRPVLIDRDDDSGIDDELEEGPAPTEPHAGRPPVDEVELVWQR